ncbi:MAG: hypothetical protein AAF542_20025 [Pseudomonadota bacterium]
MTANVNKMTKSIRHAGWAFVHGTLAIVFFTKSMIVWFPFAVLCLHNIYKFFTISSDTSRMMNSEDSIPSGGNEVQLGVLDEYEVDGDLCYGLYISIEEKSVFVDVKEDHKIDERKEIAMRLFHSQKELELEYRQFVSSHRDFENRTIDSIGLHSKDLSEAEVFWDPDGLTGLDINSKKFIA